MRCFNCGYVLYGIPMPETLPEPRCPECGRSFDPNDSVTFWTAERWWRQSGRLDLMLAIGGYPAIGTSVILGSVLEGRWRGVDALWVFVIVVPLSIIIGESIIGIDAVRGLAHAKGKTSLLLSATLVAWSDAALLFVACCF